MFTMLSILGKYTISWQASFQDNLRPNGGPTKQMIQYQI